MPDSATATALVDTLAVCNSAANFVSEVAHAHRDSNGRTPSNYDLRKLCYPEVKQLVGGSQAAQHVIKKVADAYTGVRSNLKAGNYGSKGSKRYLRAADRRVDFRPDSAQPFDSRNLSFLRDLQLVSLWTVHGRIKNIPYVGGCEQLEAFAKYPVGETDLVHRGGKWFLLATITVPDIVAERVDDFLGVDLGIENIAVTSLRSFHQGAEVKRVRGSFQSKRTELQKVGSRSAKRRLKRRSRRESRFATDVNHRVSKQIVAEAKRTGRGIALEKLKGIRERVRHRKPQRAAFHSWSFAQLTVFISYKAAMAGVPVEFVDPAYTSQRCSACGHVDRANRRDRETFRCRHCGFAEHADYNAAHNIAQRAVLQVAVVQPNVA